LGLYMAENDWTVEFHDEFDKEFNQLAEVVQNEILTLALLVKREGPQLGRPHADTLNASKYSNMKELRTKVNNGVWRIAFAFDPNRRAVMLIAADKAGKSEKRFYKQLIATADARFAQWLKEIEKNGSHT
jgi:hypothetical protein